MSLRKIAKELGVSPAYLSYMVSGKRPWRPDLYQRYQYFVNTSVNTGAVPQSAVDLRGGMAGTYGVSHGAEGGIRTRTPLRAEDFKSAASAISPPRHGSTYILPKRNATPKWRSVSSMFPGNPGGDGRIRTAE